MSDQTTTTAPETRSDASQIKVGDHLSRIQHYEVVQHDPKTGKFMLKNEQGFAFNVDPQIIEAEMYTARLYSREEKVTRTELASLLEGAGDACFTVVFDRQPTDKGVAARLEKLTPEDLVTAKARRKLARELLGGSERRLVGYIREAEPKLGRTLVVDLEVAAGKHNLRLVDHRTIKELIYKNVRYYC